MTTSTLNNRYQEKEKTLSGATGLDQFQDTVVSPPDFSESTYNKRKAALSSRQRRSIRKQDIAEVTAQLAIMTKSGVDITAALSSVASQCQREALAEVLSQIHEAVLAGNTLSDALRQHESVFEPSVIATVAAGEASGRMSDVLHQLSQMQRREIRSRRTIRAMMTYPVLLMLVSGSVITSLILFVLPRFTSIFEQYEIQLPWITQLLMGIAEEAGVRWWLWGPAAVVGIVGMLVWRSTAGGRREIDRIWIHGLVIGEACRSLLIGRTCRMLGLMLENGVPLLETLRLTRQAIGNVLYKDLLAELEDAVINGRGLGSVLAQTEIVPPAAAEMLITAERTGNLSEVANLLGEHYEEEAEAKTQQLVAILEPVMTVVMGAIVAVIVLAVMLPVFDLSSVGQGGR